MALTKLAMQVLAKFADMGCPSSKYEVFGNGAPARVDEALKELRDGLLLVAMPTADTADEYGATRFKVTAAGMTVLGRTVGVAKSGAGAGASVNGKRKAG